MLSYPASLVSSFEYRHELGCVKNTRELYRVAVSYHYEGIDEQAVLPFIGAVSVIQKEPR
tara:strand:+ start:172 stop:351 length:180 start_codon:yes stop_codon:yes gene_type:complete